MGRKAKVCGVCRICGIEDELSYEHVPPKGAYNNRPVLGFDGRVLFEHGLDPERKFGTHYQRGAGEYTLCARCNNLTGHWYGPQYIEWCFAGMQVLLRTGGQPRAIHFSQLEPLAIIKQVVTMFFSANGERFRKAQPWLEKFVRHRQAKHLPGDIRVFAYYTLSLTARRIGVAGAINLASGETRVMSEVSHPPFGYLMMFGALPPDRNLFDISHFANFDLGEKADIYTELPVRETNLPLPGDYRTRAEIDRDAALNDLAEE
jgi:hypothetical protein